MKHENRDERPIASPLYVQTMERIRRSLQQKQMGEKIDSESEYVRRLGVSLVTVRRALAELEREGWVEKRQGSRSVVGSGSSGTKRVGVLYDLDILSGVLRHGQLLRIQRSRQLLERKGYPAAVYLGDCQLSATPPEELACQQFMRDMRQGLLSGVLCGWAYPSEDWVGFLRKNNVPLVGMGPLFENMVTHDFEAYVSRALTELRSRGRRRVAYIGSFSQWNRGVEDAERQQVIARLLIEHGFEADPRRIRQDWHHSVPAAGWSMMREIWTSGRQRPDALILNSAVMWADVKRALESMGIDYRRDLDVVVADDMDRLPQQPQDGLIRLWFDAEQLVEAGVEMLATLMEGKRPLQNRVYVDAWHLGERPAHEVQALAECCDPAYGFML